MTVQARYSGECPACEGRWQPGDLIRHDGETWAHVVCPDDLPLVDGHRVPCPRCWQVPAASGACGCD